jgi:2-polyprenyl-3-methyl-5-hydroxy-6-metoxy-1,4-benzoquinol methylase
MKEQLIHYTECPVCGSVSIQKVLDAKDYTVSHKVFAVWECGQCSLRFTQDIPDQSSIVPYYKSEEYISHTNTSKGLVNNLYQKVRNYTLGVKRKLVIRQTGVQKGTLLDLGCGTGAFVNEMHTHGWNVTGLEPDADARKLGEQLYQLQIQPADQLYQLAPAQFDAITLWHVLEHVHDLHAYIQQLKVLLKEKGKIFIAVPNYTSKDAAVYKACWAAYDVPRHLYHFSPAAVDQLIQRHGMQVEKYKPMWFDSFYISLLSSKYKNGKTILVGAVWNGFLSNLAALFNVKKCSSVIYVIERNVNGQ